MHLCTFPTPTQIRHPETIGIGGVVVFFLREVEAIAVVVVVVVIVCCVWVDAIVVAVDVHANFLFRQK